MNIDNNSIHRKECIEVEFFFNICSEKFKLEIISGDEGLKRKITDQNLHRPGLALAGFLDLFSFKRIQVFGNTEVKYLQSLSHEQRQKSLEQLFEFDIPCIVFTNGNKVFDEVIEISKTKNVPIFSSKFTTTQFTNIIGDFLDDQFAPRLTVHGSFVDVYGVGVLFVGASGIGKSEVALDLIERGHRLVADDVVILTKKAESVIIGTGTELVKHFMEIRGLGLIDIEKMFGVRAIRYQKRLEVIVELEEWDKNSFYTRTGLDNETIDIMGVEIPYIKLPINPGKNITVISEVISLHYLLKHYNYNAAVEFQKRLNDTIKMKMDKKERGVNYFEHDFE